jgi:hypothetical protein
MPLQRLNTLEAGAKRVQCLSLALVGPAVDLDAAERKPLTSSRPPALK